MCYARDGEETRGVPCFGSCCGQECRQECPRSAPLPLRPYRKSASRDTICAIALDKLAVWIARARPAKWASVGPSSAARGQDLFFRADRGLPELVHNLPFL